MNDSSQPNGSPTSKHSTVSRPPVKSKTEKSKTLRSKDNSPKAEEVVTTLEGTEQTAVTTEEVTNLLGVLITAGFNVPSLIQQSRRNKRAIEREDAAAEIELAAKRLGLTREEDALARERQERERIQAENDALQQRVSQAEMFRGIALLVLLVFLVLAPLFAFVKGIRPPDYAQYLAPITGIAGTVFGYWFGQQSRR